MKKLGYCKQCLRNVPHELFFRWPVFRLLNHLPELMGRIWVSSWNCCACEKHVFVLRRPLANATVDNAATEMDDVRPFVTPRSEASRGMFLRLLFRRNTDAESLDASGMETESQEESESPASEKVGNFLRSDESLILQSTRASRYSRKYREGIVERILAGQATISQIRNELGVSEREVLDWINERVFRQQAKIAKLTQVVKSVQQLTLETEVTAGRGELGGPADDSDANSPGSSLRLFEDPVVDPASQEGDDKNTIDGSVQQRKTNP